MAGTALITLEGVLARPGGRLVASPPIPVGIALWHSLASVFRLAIVTDTTEDTEDVHHWLHNNGLRDVSYTFHTREAAIIFEERVRQVTQLRNQGNDVDIVVDPSPAVIAAVMNLGVTGLLFGIPAYARPEFRPDAPRGVRQWDDMVKAVEERHTVVADDRDIIE